MEYPLVNCCFNCANVGYGSEEEDIYCKFNPSADNFRLNYICPRYSLDKWGVCYGY